MKFLVFIIIYSFLQSQELEITPRLTYGYESDSEEYHQAGVESHDFEVGVLGRYSGGGLNIQIYLAYHWTHFMIERVLSFFFLMLTEQLKIYILPTMVLDTTPIGKALYTEKQESLIKGG